MPKVSPKIHKILISSKKKNDAKLNIEIEITFFHDLTYDVKKLIYFLHNFSIAVKGQTFEIN